MPGDLFIVPDRPIGTPDMPLFLLIVSVLLSLTATASAGTGARPIETDRWYDVEVVVFSRRPSDVEEVWPKDPGMPRLDDTVVLPDDFPSASTPRFPFQALPPSRRRLQREVERLDAADDIDVLGHLIWRQPAIVDALAPAVRIRLETTDADLPPTPPPPAATPSPDMAEHPASTPVAPPATTTDRLHPGIEGRLRLSLNRYLHLDIDLLYLAPDGPVPPDMETGSASSDASEVPSAADAAAAARPIEISGEAGNEETGPRYFRLRQSRRIRAGELHYFDHPYLGLLVLVERSPDIGSDPAPIADPSPATATVK